jgi:L-malate glycosyltransferase
MNPEASMHVLDPPRCPHSIAADGDGVNAIAIPRATAERGRPLNIAHVTDNMEIGGAQKLTSILCRLQRSHKHHVSVHCLFSVGALGQDLRAGGFDVVLYSAPSALGKMRDLYRGFKAFSPDVVHCHNPTAAVTGALPARLAGVKTVVATRHSLVKPPYQLISELRFAVASQWCDWIVAVCQSTRTNLLAAPWARRGKIVHVPNGAPAADIDAVPHSKTGFTLLHVGRLVPEKDQATLLRAVAIARRRIPDVRLWIVGDGPLGASLGQLTAELGLTDCVTFFGEQNEVSPFLVAADLFVMSSTSEGLPISLLEAMSVGLPAVVTDIGGMSEIAHLSEAVVSVTPADPQALANALFQAAARRHDLARIGQMALGCYRQNFTPEHMLDRYMHLYNHDLAEF